jgi:benzaldehyde dehydrogenase (NAD)
MLDSQLLYINGSNLPSSEGTTFPITNPMTDDHLYDCSSAGLEDYKIAIESAQAAFKSWSRIPPSSRRLIFLKAANILRTYLTEGGEVNASSILELGNYVLTLSYIAALILLFFYIIYLVF